MAEMTADHYKEIEQFVNDLPSLRAQVSDRSLLDLSGQYLVDLLAFSKDLGSQLPQNGGTQETQEADS